MWAFVFCLNQIAIIFLCGIILHYLRYKPLGQQTLFDLLIQDLLKTVIGSSSVFTVVIILSQLNSAFPEILMPQNLTLAKAACLAYYFSTLFLIIQFTLTCAIRLICVIWIGYLVTNSMKTFELGKNNHRAIDIESTLTSMDRVDQSPF